MTPAPYTRKERIVIPAANVPRLAAALKVSVEYLVQCHLEHGGVVDDRNGDLICWPIVADDEEAAE